MIRIVCVLAMLALLPGCRYVFGDDKASKGQQGQTSTPGPSPAPAQTAPTPAPIVPPPVTAPAPTTPQAPAAPTAPPAQATPAPAAPTVPVVAPSPATVVPAPSSTVPSGSTPGDTTLDRLARGLEDTNRNVAGLTSNVNALTLAVGQQNTNIGNLTTAIGQTNTRLDQLPEICTALKDHNDLIRRHLGGTGGNASFSRSTLPGNVHEWKEVAGAIKDTAQNVLETFEIVDKFRGRDKIDDLERRLNNLEMQRRRAKIAVPVQKQHGQLEMEPKTETPPVCPADKDAHSTGLKDVYPKRRSRYTISKLEAEGRALPPYHTTWHEW